MGLGISFKDIIDSSSAIVPNITKGGAFIIVDVDQDDKILEDMTSGMQEGRLPEFFDMIPLEIVGKFAAALHIDLTLSDPEIDSIFAHPPLTYSRIQYLYENFKEIFEKLTGSDPQDFIDYKTRYDDINDSWGGDFDARIVNYLMQITNVLTEILEDMKNEGRIELRILFPDEFMNIMVHLMLSTDGLKELLLIPFNAFWVPYAEDQVYWNYDRNRRRMQDAVATTTDAAAGAANATTDVAVSDDATTTVATY